MEYPSFEVFHSRLVSGVTYSILKMSFGRRVELTRRIRDLASKREFLEAGETPQDKMDAGLLAAEIDRIYVMWGLKEITGLEVDGVTATPEILADYGPEELYREALSAIKQQCGLSEAERKN